MRSSVRRKARTSTRAITTARTARSGVRVWNRLKALPVFRLRRNSTVVPMSETGESRRACTAHAFVAWSSATTPTTIPTTSRPRPASAGPGSASPLGTRLAIDAHLRPRNGLQALEGDLAPRGLADPVLAALHPVERVVDLLDDLA